MAKSIKKNYVYNLLYQVLILVVPLVTTPYVSRTLGAEAIGEYSYAYSINYYFTLIAILGTGTYAEREISFYQDDRGTRSRRFWDLFTLRCITSVFCTIFYFVFIAFFFRDNLTALIVSLNIAAVAFDIVWLFQGMEEFGQISLRNTIVKIISVVCVFIFIKKPEDVALYALIMSLSPIIGSLSLFPFVSAYIDKPVLRNIHPFRDFSNIIRLFIPTIAISIYTVLDSTMLGLFTSTKVENGYYEQALKLSKTTLTIVTSLGAVMIPRISYFFQKGETEEIKTYMYKSYRFVFMIGLPICFGLIAIADNLVPWFYGDGFEKVSSLLKISSLLVIAIGLSNVTGMQYLVPTMRQDKLTASVIIGAVTNFFCNLILIPRFYSVGAIIASVIAEFTVTCVQFCYVRKNLSIRKIFSLSVHYLIASIFMLLLVIAEGTFLEATPLNTIIMIASGVIAYFLVLLIERDEFVFYAISRGRDYVLRLIKGDRKG